MATQPSDSTYYPINGTLQQFNRYGLPGLVIGAQFLIIVGLLYFGMGAIKEATRAMVEVTGALNQLTHTIREMK